MLFNFLISKQVVQASLFSFLLRIQNNIPWKYLERFHQKINGSYVRWDIFLESSSVAWNTGSVLVSECWTDTALKLFWGIISQSYFYRHFDRPKLSKKFLSISAPKTLLWVVSRPPSLVHFYFDLVVHRLLYFTQAIPYVKENVYFKLFKGI